MRLKYLIISLFATLLGTSSLTAQQEFLLNKESSTLKISGTSNVHDWEMEATEFNGSTEMVLDGSNISQIKNIEFSCEVGGLESNNKIMDKKTWKALNKEKFPDIVFQIETPQSIKTENNTIEISGKLTIAGVTRDTNLDLLFEPLDNGTFRITGKLPVKMTDFNIDPPTALMGAMTTGDEVVISYNFEIKSKSDNTINS